MNQPNMYPKCLNDAKKLLIHNSCTLETRESVHNKHLADPLPAEEISTTQQRSHIPVILGFTNEEFARLAYSWNAYG